MIDFRYHIVSIVAIFIALAVGIVLGSGPLKDDISGFLEARTNQLASQKVELQDEVESLRGELEASEQYAELTAPAILKGLLLTQPVAIIELPDSEEDDARRVQEAVEQAGGQVAARVRIEPAWTDPGEADVLDRIAGGRGVEGAQPYELASQVLARALVTDNARIVGQQFVTGLGVLAAFEEEGFLTVNEEDVVRGGSVIVIGSSNTDEAASQTLVPLIEAMDAGSQGTVVAGPLSSASEGGIVAVVRGGELAARVSTEDRLDTNVGTTVTVLALVDQRRDKVGHYGTGEGAESVAPDPVPGS